MPPAKITHTAVGKCLRRENIKNSPSMACVAKQTYQGLHVLSRYA